MRWVVAGVALLAGALSAGFAVPVQPASQVQSGSPVVTVELDQTEVTAGPGEKIRFESTVRNTGGRPLSGLIAHVNILTSDPDVYVDPEDWSPRRTQFLDELAPAQVAHLTWDVQAVTAGPLILYVAVTDPNTDAVAVSGPLHMTVGGKRVVNAGGVLPLVMGMPAAILVLLGIAGIRRRRRR